MSDFQLLGEGDPAAVEEINVDGAFPVAFTCEHASKNVPRRLNQLGLDEATLSRHIGWDIGAAEVTHQLAAKLGAPAVLQGFSRLVVDCNRPPEADDAMPPESDHIQIPGNKTMAPGERGARIDEIFVPYDNAVKAMRTRGSVRALLSIHSFTPVMDGFKRPWDIGFLYRADTKTSDILAKALRGQDPDLCIGFNRPYDIDDESDWFVPKHGEPSGLPHCLIEIRNDHITDADGQNQWATLLANAVRDFVEHLDT